MKNQNETPEVKILKEDHTNEFMLVVGVILLLILLVWFCTRSMGQLSPISMGEIMSQLEG